jgi:hypothetical protein
VSQLPLSASKKPALSALNDDARAAGELKDVAGFVYPEAAQKDPEKARNDLADALRANHARKLDIDELMPIVIQAVIESGRSSLIEHMIAQLPKDSCEFKWLSKEEKIARVTVTLSQLLPQCVAAFEQAQKLLVGTQK